MITTSEHKTTLFAQVKEHLRAQDLTIEAEDASRPWGGFFRFPETQVQQFANLYFDGLDTTALYVGGALSPKLLLVAPHQRLSWQYHHRRAEIWQVVQGPVGVATSLTDAETHANTYTSGQLVVLQQGERHRLIGLDTWGIVAEIWQHTDALHPSDESDIVRVQDDFARK